MCLTKDILHKTPGADLEFPVGGPTLIQGGGAPMFQCRHVLVKTYVTMKELGPVGGGGSACR